MSAPYSEAVYHIVTTNADVPGSCKTKVKPNETYRPYENDVCLHIITQIKNIVPVHVIIPAFKFSFDMLS